MKSRDIRNNEKNPSALKLVITSYDILVIIFIGGFPCIRIYIKYE